MHVLVTAPYVGEIGWELMSWQARVRKIFKRGSFDRFVVLGAAGKSAFYGDMPMDYHEVDLSTLPGQPYEDRRIIYRSCDVDEKDPQIPARSASEGSSVGIIMTAETIRDAVLPMVELAVAKLRNQRCEVEALWPDYAGTIYPCESEHQTFVRFERSLSEPMNSPWVVLVQRSRNMGAENWSAQQWDELSDRLRARGINTSFYPCESAEAIAVASHADLAVGQSTGGLHLASLCGCPQMVWSVGKTHLWTPWEMTNRQRYETFWNPLGTPVVFHETEDLPTVEQVSDWTIAAVQRIGRRTGSAVTRFKFRKYWCAKDWLVRNVIRRRDFKQWPWPVQRFVRYQLV